MDLVTAALALPWPVFACNADKQPITPHGHKDATRDPVLIQAQFAHPAARLIGVPTGKASGLIVLDIDIKGDAEGDIWLANQGQALPQTLIHGTQSGGWHFVLLNPTIAIRNSASRIAPGVDVRGEGGYVIVPPSPGYRVIENHRPAPMPQWLVDKCLKPPEPPPPPPLNGNGHHHREYTKYVQSALDAELRAVANATEGTRNDQLNVSAFKIGTLIGAGHMARDDAEFELTRAGRHAGLDHREITATIKSGLNAGIAAPRQMPEREPPPPRLQKASFEATPPNEAQEGLPFTSFDEVDPALQSNDFVEDLFANGSLVVIYGEPGSGKTFFALDVCLHVAAGRLWRDRAVEHGAIIYLALEGGNGIRNRIAAARSHLVLPKGTALALVQCPVDLRDSEADIQAVVATCLHVAKQFGLPVRAIVADTLARAIGGGNENASEDMGALIINSDRIRAETGAALIYIHHSGKDSAKGSRGHSSLKAAIDTEIEVVQGTDGVSIARVTRQRDLESEGYFPFTLKPVELGVNQRGKQISSCIVLPVPAPDAPPPTRRPLSGIERTALRCLDKALAADAITATVFDNDAEGLVVQIDDWRDWFYREGMPGADDRRKQQAFRRATDGLLDKGRIASRDDFVWPLTR